MAVRSIEEVEQYTSEYRAQQAPPSETIHWGKVYQNYISTNVSSEQLAKGAFDAFNILSDGKLTTFQQDSIDKVNALVRNQTQIHTDLVSLETRLNNVVTNLDKGLLVVGGTGHIDSADVTSVTNRSPLYFPTNDAGTKNACYQGANEVGIPFAGSVINGEARPGLMKAADAVSLTNIKSAMESLFETQRALFEGDEEQPESFFFTTDFESVRYNRGPISLIFFLAAKINSLENRLQDLRGQIENFINGSSVFGTIKVKGLTFVNDGQGSLEDIWSDDSLNNWYVNPTKFDKTI